MAQVFKSTADAQVAKLLLDGAIGVIPTDTVYGIVCSAKIPDAVAKLYGLKDRNNQPGTHIAANIDQLVDLGFKRRYLTAVEQFWPGAISVEMPFNDPDRAYLNQNQPTFAVRIPSDENLHALLLKTGPLVTSSANSPGKEPAKNYAEAKAYFGNKVDFYVDGGEINNPPSTIIRIVDDEVEVLRDGAVKIDNNGMVK